jgi:hypothetical protein
MPEVFSDSGIILIPPNPPLEKGGTRNKLLKSTFGKGGFKHRQLEGIYGKRFRWGMEGEKGQTACRLAPGSGHEGKSSRKVFGWM